MKFAVAKMKVPTSATTSAMPAHVPIEGSKTVSVSKYAERIHATVRAVSFEMTAANVFASINATNHAT